MGLEVGCPHLETFAFHLKVAGAPPPKVPVLPLIFCRA